MVELLVAGANIEGKIANYPYISSYESNQYLRKYVDDGDYLLALKAYSFNGFNSVYFYATLRINGKVVAISDNKNEWRMIKFQDANYVESGVTGYDQINYDDSGWFNVPSNCDGFAPPFNDKQILDPLNPAQPYSLSSCYNRFTNVFARLKFNTNGTVYNAGEPYTFDKRQTTANLTLHRVFGRVYYPQLSQLTLSSGSKTYTFPYSVLSSITVDDHFYWDVPDGKYVLAVQIPA